MKWGAFGLALSGAAFFIALNTSAFAASAIDAYGRTQEGTIGSHRSSQPADSADMHRQRPYNAPNGKSVPRDERDSSGATTDPRANWAGDSAPNPDDDDPNPVYPI
jgi:hypothetical protein